jgi:hypothetical protein
MAFQFLCPQGHLLQGDESQAGQQCKCPYCESLFLVPQPLVAAPVEPAEPEPTPPPGLFGDAAPPSLGAGGAPDFSWAQQPAPGYEPQPGPPPQEQAGGFPGIRVDADVAGGGSGGPSVADLPGGAQIVHVICPSGHELETPREMLGQDALCPYCQVQFRLRFEDSTEYRRQKEEERELREIKAGKAWLQWSIAAAVVVIFGIILMIVVVMAK